MLAQQTPYCLVNLLSEYLDDYSDCTDDHVPRVGSEGGAGLLCHDQLMHGLTRGCRAGSRSLSNGDRNF